MESVRVHAERHLGRLVADKYLLKRVLGVGGHGAVYEATHRWTNRRVAVKLLLGAAAAGPTATERFLREARASTRVAHPNIVEVLDMGRDEALDGMYLVEEFLEGEDLRMRLRREERLTPRDAVDLALPVARALAAAHLAGVIHRDVKPANIFLARAADGSVAPKLIDFGVSRVLAAEAEEGPLTMTGTPIGTPDYMSPEQARGARDLDGRTDQWALGVVLYELLSGVRPFRGATYNALIFRVALEAPVALGERVPSLPEALVAAVHRCLEKDPAARFAAMEDLITALDAMREGLSTTRPAVVAIADAPAGDTPVPPPDTLAGSAPASDLPAAQPPLPIAGEALASALAEGARASAVLPEVSDEEIDRAVARRRVRERAVAGVAITGLALGAAALSARVAPTPHPTRVAPVAQRLGDGSVDASASAMDPVVAEPVREPLVMGLSSSQVRLVASPARASLRRCLGATFFGQVLVVFSVRPDGTVARATPQGALAGTERGRCVSETLAALRFPAFVGRAPLEVSWRYVYAPNDG